uniref:Uncharacterized protein n=1 Tax=Glossina palpalis gambiensis TaxID=67801 RepID=A0A1B0AKF0_9MUSC
MRASHSSCIVLRVAGILVALGGFDFTIGGVFTSIKSSIFISLPLIGSQPFSVMYFSIIRFSKIAPEKGDTTAISGTSFPLTTSLITSEEGPQKIATDTSIPGTERGNL